MLFFMLTDIVQESPFAKLCMVDDPQTWALLEQIFYRKPCFLMEYF